MRLVHDFCLPHAFIWGLTNYRTSFSFFLLIIQLEQ
jgi:hypothetical protein